jgi:hypothetical protein
MMNPEQAETSPVATEEAITSSTPGYVEELTGKGAEPELKTAPETSQSKDALPDSKPTVNLDEEVILEIGGKEFKVKVGQALEALEYQQKLTEKEKNLDKGYTQKFQSLSKERESIELLGKSIGAQVTPELAKAVGTVYQTAYKDPLLADILNAVAAGQDYKRLLGQQTNNQSTDPTISALQQEINGLKQQLGTFTSSFQEKEQAQTLRAAKGDWDKFVETQKSQGNEVTEEIDKGMAVFITALKSAHPEMDNQSILAEAYRHATIGSISQTAVKNVLIDADKAKKTGSIRIRPRAPSKPDSEKTYSEIIAEQMPA